MRVVAGPSLLLGLTLLGCSFPPYRVDGQLGEAGQSSVSAVEPPPGTCGDGKQGAKETDVDCGGICPPCAAGLGCQRLQDCESGSCVDGVCQMARCDDGVRNGGEADVDCGGVCDKRCDVGALCSSARDCSSNVCTDTCQAVSCSDGVLNGSETAPDCGGPCRPCNDGQTCLEGSDCTSGQCSSLICVAVSCTDKKKDGAETDVDCGGTCAPCPGGATCVEAADCQSNICRSDQSCSAATCTDKVKNGTETDVDCGGSCPGCASNQACTGGSDCKSGLCNGGFCVPAKEAGTQLGPSGWSAMANYSNEMCSAAFDGSTYLRWATGVNQEPGMWFTLDLGSPQIFFSVVLRAYDASFTEPDDGPALFDVYESNDGSFALPAKQNLPGSATTTIHFDSAQRARYIQFKLDAVKDKWWSINELYLYQ
jgi:hypothetical protein